MRVFAFRLLQNGERTERNVERCHRTVRNVVRTVLHVAISDGCAGFLGIAHKAKCRVEEASERPLRRSAVSISEH